MRQLEAVVRAKEEVMAGHWLMELEAPGLAEAASPGQFLYIKCGDDVQPLLRRAFSLHRLPRGRPLAILFQVLGGGTAWLARRVIGETLDAIGPLGKGFTLSPKAARVLLIAGGMGIGPLAALAEEALGQGKKVRLLMGAASASRLLPRSLLPVALEYYCITEDGSAGQRGLVTQLAPELVGDVDQIFACGPEGMLRALQKTLPPLTDRPIQVAVEQRMGCGVGACLGCMVETAAGYQRACADGPVFELRELVFP